MKSPHTIIKGLERAICIQEMIAKAQQYQKGYYKNSKELKTNKALLFFGNRREVERNIRRAWKYRRISNYLQKRYESLLNNLK